MRKTRYDERGDNQTTQIDAKQQKTFPCMTTQHPRSDVATICCVNEMKMHELTNNKNEIRKDKNDIRKDNRNDIRKAKQKNKNAQLACKHISWACKKMTSAKTKNDIRKANKIKNAQLANTTK